jgi:hypothetical protein
VESFLGSTSAPKTTTVQPTNKNTTLDDLNSLQSFTVKKNELSFFIFIHFI